MLPTLPFRPFLACALLAAVLLPLPSGCGDDSGEGQTGLAPPPPGRGFQLTLQAELKPGEEHEFCKFFEVPESWAVRDEVRFTPGSHHVLLYQTQYTSIPTSKDTGEIVDTSGVFDCSDGATNGWSTTTVVAGSQNRLGESMLAFPAGVAAKVGGVMLLNVHYLNASDQVLQPTIYLNVHTIDASQVQTEGGLLFLYNPFIYVPSNGSSRARWSCPVHKDIHIVNLQAHMHARGVGYQATLNDAGQRTPLYQTDAWEGVPVKTFGDGLLVRAGSRLDYSCEYRNSEARAVVQGPSANDEMCMLIGSYYPVDSNTSECLTAAGDGLGGQWIGDGTASCAATLECALAAADDSALTQCVYASRPDVSTAMTAALLCTLSSPSPETECAEQVAACAAL